MTNRRDFLAAAALVASAAPAALPALTEEM